MPRRPRLVLSDVPLHIIQRGHNRHKCFFIDSDYLVYLSMLHECADAASCSVHAYVLMTNHVHLLISPHRADAPASLMKALGQRYVQYVNRHQGRTGTLWEGRFRSCLVQDASYLLICQRYIELNPVRAQMVMHPSHYQWSSYRTNAHGLENPLITPHAIYGELANEKLERETAYRELFRDRLPAQAVDKVRLATNGNFALGDDQFAGQMTNTFGRDVVRHQAGRPRNPKPLPA